jgi:predicted nuclease of predicted toxin-antitoxin system
VRVLLDECVPLQLKRDLTGHTVSTVRDMGWSGVKNGALIELAAEHFDAIFTVDREFGTRLPDAPKLAIVILEAGSTDPVRLRPHMPAVVQALAEARLGQITRLGA